MASFVDMICEGKCNDLLSIVDNGTSKFLLFTRVDKNTDNFIICASDGLEFWRLEMDNDEFDVLRELSNMNSEAYMSNLRCSFHFISVLVFTKGLRLKSSLKVKTFVSAKFKFVLKPNDKG